ncbi:MAG: hypothetical protein HC830_03355 [Bacteroidetes bacterium]|nr:hypothetical protein [Bacteroidota bacterium]
MENPEGFMEKLYHYQNTDLGLFEVSDLELIHNDWYHRRKYTEVLETIKPGWK